MQFDFNLRKLTDEEVADMPDDALAAGIAIQEYWAARGGFPNTKRDTNEDA